MVHDPFTNFSNGEVFKLIIHAFVHGVDLNSGNLVFFIRNTGVFGDVSNGKLAENYLSCNFFGNSFRSNSEVSVAGFGLVSFCENVFDITEFISFSVKSGFQFQGENSFPFSAKCRKLVNLYFPFLRETTSQNISESRTQFHIIAILISRDTSPLIQLDYIKNSKFCKLKHGYLNV